MLRKNGFFFAELCRPAFSIPFYLHGTNTAHRCSTWNKARLPHLLGTRRRIGAAAQSMQPSVSPRLPLTRELSPQVTEGETATAICVAFYSLQYLSPTALTGGAPSSEGATKFSVQQHSYGAPRKKHKAQAGVTYRGPRKATALWGRGGATKRNLKAAPAALT